VVTGGSDESQAAGVRVFIAERDIAGVTAAHIGDVHRALGAAARRVTTPDHPVSYLRTIYIPGENRCICVFQANDAATVALVNDTAQVPLGQIAESIEFRVGTVGTAVRAARL
jgi:predicted regulator of Ras-like GTPase activity (Roadblock/LC7/MglB family)